MTGIGPIRSRRLALVFLAILGLIFSVAMLFALMEWEKRHAQENFEKAARERRELLQRGINGDLEVLYSIGAFFNGSQRIDREEFSTFVSDALVRHPEINTLQWQPLILSPARETFEKNNLTVYSAKRRIWQIDSSGRPVEAGAKEAYFPFQFIEPQLPNSKWLGLDTPIGSLTLAESIGIPATASLIVSRNPYRLTGDASADNMINIYLPVFSHKAKAGVNKDLAGFASLALNLEKLLKIALHNFTSPPIDVIIPLSSGDKSASQAINLQQVDNNQEISGLEFWQVLGDTEWKSELKISGQLLPVIFKSQAVFFQPGIPLQLWMVMAAGLLYFALSMGYLWASEKSRLRIGHLVSDLSRESEARAVAAEKLSESEARLQRQNAALVNLTRRVTRNIQDIKPAFREITELAAHTMAVARVGIWLYSPDRSKIFCRDLYQVESSIHSEGDEVAADSCPAYFAAIDQERIVSIDDAQNDPRTRDLTETYLKPLCINSMLDAPIIQGGLTSGVICFEHTGPLRHWEISEETFAGSLAEYLALALETQARLAVDEKRGHLARIIEALPDVVATATVTPDYQCNYLNKAGYDLLGLGEDIDLPLDLLQTFFSTDAIDQQVSVAIPHAVNHGIWSGETTVIARDSEIPVHQIMVAHKDEQGKIQYISMVLRDLRAEKAAQEELREQERFLSALVANLPGAAYRRRNAEGWPMEYMSHGCLDLTGYPAEKIIANDPPYNTLAHPDDHDRLYAEIDAAIKEHRFFEVEYRLLRADGRIIWVWTKGHGIYSDDGTLIAREGFIEDITERVQAEHKLQQLNAELEERIAERTAKLEEVNQNLESFAYSVSHDLKAPLRGIDGYSRLLLEDYRDNLPEEARGFLETIRMATGRMNEIIDDLLAYSRLERRAINMTSIAIKPLLTRILAEREYEIQQTEAQISLEVGDATVKADVEGLLLVLRNMVDNALKFSRHRTPPEIVIATCEGDAAITLSVADNGCGFDMKYHDRIFEIFQRLHRVEEYGGTGIGLAIVRKAVERMEGRVWAEGSPDRGATFFLELLK